MKNENPFLCNPPKEISLINAPLVKVLSQVRFPLIVAIENQEFVAPFQESIRKQYPVLRREQLQEFVIGPKGMTPGNSETVWRFNNESKNWTVSLAPSFIALETSDYNNNEDFLNRFKEIIVSLNENIEPKVIDRVGLRFIDRVQGDNVDKIKDIILPEMCGIAGSIVSEQIKHTVTETLFELGDSSLLARWATVPANGRVAPINIEPVDKKSWILDLDMFSDKQHSFEVDPLLTMVRGYADRIYSFFRWAVRDDFLKLFGGNL